MKYRPLQAFSHRWIGGLGIDPRAGRIKRNMLTLSGEP